MSYKTTFSYYLEGGGALDMLLKFLFTRKTVVAYQLGAAKSEVSS